MDSITPEHRSWNMAQIKGKDTKIEVIVRQYLFSHGFRFRKNDSRYPGKPDIVLPKYNTVIFINGCFWHRHQGCKYATMPKSRIEYWEKKFSRNVENDKTNIKKLKDMGWHVIIIWECQLKKEAISETMKNVISEIKSYEEGDNHGKN